MPADYGLDLARGKGYVWSALLWGVFFGLLMTVVDYTPQLLAHAHPDPGFPLTRGNKMNWAGVIAAVIFALLHATNFATRHWPQALGQQIYAFALGVLYAYWLEKSGSTCSHHRPQRGRCSGATHRVCLVRCAVTAALTG